MKNEEEMGAKSVVKLRNRGIAFKCDICGLKLMTEEDLDSHRRTAHNVITKRQKRSQEASKPMKPVKSSTKNMLKEDSEEENSSTSKSTTPQTTTTTKKKDKPVEFECPKCYKRFPTYFPALKHIQKYHCANRQDNEGPQKTISPVRVELCTRCMCKVRSIHTHVCNGANPGSLQTQVVCAACEECFPTIKMFDFHIVTFHGSDIESMFFPTTIEFTKWKTEMEQQTKASYTMQDQYEIKNKRYYHCNRVLHKDQICPSTIVIQELPKGVQVHFYHKHHKHDSAPYKLPQKYSKYSIMTFLKRAEDYSTLEQLQSDEDDLYMQFKTLMEGIIVDAAKINIQTLKIILGKALEITSILTNYDEELEDITTIPSRPSQSQTMSDIEIIKALEEPLAKRKSTETIKTTIDTTTKTTNTTSNSTLLDVNLAKRKSESASSQEIKRPKTEINENKNASPKIINAFSLADTKSKDSKLKTATEKLIMTEIETTHKVNEEDKTKSNGDDTPSSFNDSYKSFVVKNFPHMESVASRTRSKPILKTRIGQFKPAIIKTHAKTKSVFKNDEQTDTINKNDEKTNKNVTINDAKPKSILKTNAVNKNDEKTKSVTSIGEKTNKSMTLTTETDCRTRSSLTKTNAITKTIGVKNTGEKTKSLKVVQITKAIPRDVKPDAVDKEKTKTRTQSKAQSINRISRSSLDKPKVDFEYEVKEQPDDCNILILKI